MFHTHTNPFLLRFVTLYENTCFKWQKYRTKLNLFQQFSTPPLPITSSVTPSPRDPSHLIASEMIQLRMKLEEKRRAIEAQKKKVKQTTKGSNKTASNITDCFFCNVFQVEAAFTRHRQKMGRTAFLNIVKRKGVTAPPGSGGAATDSSKRSSQASVEQTERCKPDGAAPKSPFEDAGE